MWLTDNEKKALQDFREKNKDKDTRSQSVKDMWLSVEELQMIIDLRRKDGVKNFN